MGNAKSLYIDISLVIGREVVVAVHVNQMAAPSRAPSMDVYWRGSGSLLGCCRPGSVSFL